MSNRMTGSINFCRRVAYVRTDNSPNITAKALSRKEMLRKYSNFANLCSDSYRGQRLETNPRFILTAKYPSAPAPVGSIAVDTEARNQNNRYWHIYSQQVCKTNTGFKIALSILCSTSPDNVRVVQHAAPRFDTQQFRLRIPFVH